MGVEGRAEPGPKVGRSLGGGRGRRAGGGEQSSATAGGGAGGPGLSRPTLRCCTLAGGLVLRPGECPMCSSTGQNGAGGGQAKDGPRPPARTLGFSSDMIASGGGVAERWRGIKQRGSGQVTLSARRSPAATARGAALCPPNPRAPVGRGEVTWGRACTTRAPGVSSARPLGLRFPTIRNASRGGAPRHLSTPTPGGARGTEGWG